MTGPAQPPWSRTYPDHHITMPTAGDYRTVRDLLERLARRDPAIEPMELAHILDAVDRRITQLDPPKKETSECPSTPTSPTSPPATPSSSSA